MGGGAAPTPSLFAISIYPAYPYAVLPTPQPSRRIKSATKGANSPSLDLAFLKLAPSPPQS